MDVEMRQKQTQGFVLLFPSLLFSSFELNESTDCLTRFQVKVDEGNETKTEWGKTDNQGEENSTQKHSEGQGLTFLFFSSQR